jgi:hypothetical protein
MGAAKRRGSYEDRVAQAKARNAIEANAVALGHGPNKHRSDVPAPHTDRLITAAFTAGMAVASLSTPNDSQPKE